MGVSVRCSSSRHVAVTSLSCGRAQKGHQHPQARDRITRSKTSLSCSPLKKKTPTPAWLDSSSGKSHPQPTRAHLPPAPTATTPHPLQRKVSRIRVTCGMVEDFPPRRVGKRQQLSPRGGVTPGRGMTPQTPCRKAPGSRLRPCRLLEVCCVPIEKQALDIAGK